MTSTKNAKTTAADVFASLDAMPTPAAPAAQAPQPSQSLEDAQASAALAAALADPQGQALVVKIHKRKGEQLAREALAGITSGRPRRELHRPKYGQQAELALPVNSQGRLDVTSELVAGRSRRYAQDLEGWGRAALADHAQRGVLVIWDGMAYTITLDPAVQPRTVVEVHRRDVLAWRARQG
jgi:hypothetical protein